MYEFSRYLNYFLAGYVISTIVFLIVTLFQNRFKKLRVHYLNLSNLTALFLSLAVTGILIINYISNSTQNKEAEPASLDYYTLIHRTVLFSGLVPLLFLNKRLRKSVLVTLVVIVAISWFLFYERIYMWIIQFNRDYMPSGWSVAHREVNAMLFIMVATFIYFALTFIVVSNKNKKNV